MSQPVSGIVSLVTEKDWFDQRTNTQIKLYSFQLQGGNQWYRTGRTPVGAVQGQGVAFTVGDKGNVDKGSLQIQQGVPQAQQTPQTPTQGLPPMPAPPQQFQQQGQNREGYWTAKEQRDIEKDERYQTNDIPRMSFSASQERAVTLVSAALGADALSFGSSAKGKRLDLILKYVDEVTNRFYLQSMNSPQLLRELEEEAAYQGQTPDSTEENFDE